jgi:hypothetical protein
MQKHKEQCIWTRASEMDCKIFIPDSRDTLCKEIQNVHMGQGFGNGSGHIWSGLWNHNMQENKEQCIWTRDSGMGLVMFIPVMFMYHVISRA